MHGQEYDVIFSQISLFEIAIKQKIGKLPDFTAELEAIYRQSLRAGFRFLPIQNARLFGYHKIPLFEQHRDPFDRLLLASAYQKNLILLSADNHFALYKQWVQVFWPQ
ncbi:MULTISPECIES: type II toxin-antitoxin system VapC family toxin [Methylomonas]|uniref:type II toxin-antitoxin system VapC family toxin n=1 Tax=Methylomonas TaxID=416 RepID=UPI0012318C61|nr:type II toxin-antitoxin system VapC family toxin [Methylomonas rhizoryzae]